jgi:hypothetical protein
MPARKEPGELDAAVRFAIKLAPEDHARWLQPKLSADLGFARWLDTELIAFPGEPRRRCDTVAELVSRSGSQAPWALVIEAEARPRSVILGRLLEYLLRVFRRVRHGPRGRDPYQVAGALIVLTGHQRGLHIDMRLPETPLALGWTAGVMNVAEEDATQTLARIAAKALGRGILVWVPLMAGADSPEVADEWARLMRLETDAERQREIAGLARVFAEWVGRIDVWEKALEGWEMETWKSKTIETWRAQGRIETQRANLLRVMQLKFRVEIPAELIQLIQGTKDLKTLADWLDHVVLVETLTDFLAVVQPPPGQGKNGANGS